MQTIRQLTMQWWNNLPFNSSNTKISKTHYYNQYFGYKGAAFTMAKDYTELTGSEIENIFYNEVIVKWWSDLKIGVPIMLISTYLKKANYKFPTNEEIKEIYLKEHSKEEPKERERGITITMKGQPLVNKDVEVDGETLESKVRNLFSPIKNYISVSRNLLSGDTDDEIVKIAQEEGLKADQNIYAIISEIHNSLLSKVEDNSWDEVAKILSNTKYGLPIVKGDTTVYVVDIPKVIEKLKQHYILTKK